MAKFGAFVPQGWKMDLVEIDDPVEKFEAMTAVAKLADKSNLGLDLGLRPLSHRADARARNHLRVLDDHRHPGARHRAGQDRADGRLQRLSQSRALRQDRVDGRCRQSRPALRRHRRRWYEHEWRAYGYEWNETPVRMGKFREAVEIIHAMWTEEKAVFNGKYYHDRRRDQ